jgi:hypothetical protein
MKISVGAENQNFDARMWLDINSTDYQLCDQGPVDFHISCFLDGSTTVLPKPNTAQQHLVLDIWHNTSNQIQTIRDKINQEIWITNAWDPTNDNEHIIFNDFLFNRTKAYYSQFAFSPETQLWYHHHSTAYNVPRLVGADHKQRIFVCPAKTYGGKRKFRKLLVEHLVPARSLGYMGNYDDQPDLFLYSHLEFPYPDFGIDQLRQQTRPMSYNFWGYSPPHSAYYTDSFISVYCETVESGSTITITEKTWDPLIKGHFVLPFGTAGLIQRLQDLGIRLPDFIDYSYDQEPVDQLRWNKYKQELDRLLNMSLVDWQQHWTDNLGLLLYNQRYFQQRDYDRVNLERFLQ